MRILIVDDDPINQKYLNAMLASYGEIEMAADGVQATEIFERELQSQQPFDVIFLDIMMPKMDGHETLHAIREMEISHGLDPNKRVKVVMVTALGDKENVLSAFSEGIEYYLVKPFKQSKVFQLMEELGFKGKS